MAGKIWYYDCYDLRKFKIDDIHTFVDIGANIGSVSLMVKILMPHARIVAIEPCQDNFNLFKKNIWCWNKIRIECYHMALGDGSPLYIKRSPKYHGLHKFFTDAEVKDLNLEREAIAPSKTLKQIFDDYKIDMDQPYIIKIDCEGGERFLLQQDCLDILQNATQIMFELHIGVGGSGEEWNEFLQKFSSTHELKLGGYEPGRKDPNRKFVYRRINEFNEKKGRYPLELVKLN